MNDLTGQKFGRLIVLRRSQTKNTKIFWLCKCECGKIHEASGALLVRGNIKSCGCYKRDVHSLPGDEGSFNELFRIYALNAKKSKRPFSLTKEEFREISCRPCFYCGELPKPFYSRNRKNGVLPFVSNGIDRINNMLGYEKANCLACCGVCNFMKRDMSIDDFKEHIGKISTNMENRDV